MEEINKLDFNNWIEFDNINMFKFSHFGIELYFYLDLFTKNKDDYKVVISSKDYYKVININSIVWHEKNAEFITEIFHVNTKSENILVCFKNIRNKFYYRKIELKFGRLLDEELILTVKVDYEKQL